jgi:lipid-A-disaccharide synthase
VTGASPRIYFSAGEPSGDAHAAAVAAALRRRLPGATLEAFGGPALAAAGATVTDRMEDYSVVGFVEAIGAIPAHYRLLHRTMDAVKAGRYDLVVLVDYPGYHLRLAERVAERGVPVLYYVAPQLWAWGVSRVRRLRAVRRVAILPFEEEFFRSHGIAATFVGHPLPDRPAPPAEAPAKRTLDSIAAPPCSACSQAADRCVATGPSSGGGRAATRARPELQVVAGTRAARTPGRGRSSHHGDGIVLRADAGLASRHHHAQPPGGPAVVIAYRLQSVSYFIVAGHHGEWAAS